MKLRNTNARRRRRRIFTRRRRRPAAGIVLAGALAIGIALVLLLAGAPPLLNELGVLTF